MSRQSEGDRQNAENPLQRDRRKVIGYYFERHFTPRLTATPQ
jgi:hypothetical protein